MKRKRLGRTELKLPVIGLGTAFTGIPTPRQTMSEYLQGDNQVDEELGVKTLVDALDTGYRFIDTAVLYGRALSETMIGEALRQRPQLRDEIIVTTKAGRTYEGFDFSFDGILKSVYASLERMGLDRMELVYIHDPMDFPMADVLSDRGALGALRHLQAQGVIRFVGTAANDPATNLPYIGTGEFDAAVIADSWSLINLTAERGIFDAAQEHDVGLVVATALERGLLVTGPIAGAEYLNRYFSPACLDQVRKIQRLCERYSIPMIAAALQWCGRHPQVTSTIPGARISEEASLSFSAVQIDIPDAFWSELQDLVKHFDTVTGN
ncbi:MAG: aldo/keto reductase [Chloroflexi bacterium]|nr:aldo/keto reductase [Chloroflexota bacterium]